MKQLMIMGLLICMSPVTFSQNLPKGADLLNGSMELRLTKYQIQPDSSTDTLEMKVRGTFFLCITNTAGYAELVSVEDKKFLSRVGIQYDKAKGYILDPNFVKVNGENVDHKTYDLIQVIQYNKGYRDSLDLTTLVQWDMIEEKKPKKITYYDQTDGFPAFVKQMSKAIKKKVKS